MAISRPKWCQDVKEDPRARIKHTIRNKVPINTCNPWNPVAMKNVDPKTLSLIVKEEMKYSIAWSKVKYNPRTIVTAHGTNHWELPIKLWWAQVTLTPELRRIRVLSRGPWKGLNAVSMNGGQTLPTSCAGVKEEWKNVQKKAAKKQTSLRMKRSIPNLSPSTISGEYSPPTDSDTTSYHHANIWINRTTMIIKKNIADLYLNQNKNLDNKPNPVILVQTGQGDILTKWVGVKMISKLFLDPKSYRDIIQ